MTTWYERHNNLVSSTDGRCQHGSTSQLGAKKSNICLLRIFTLCAVTHLANSESSYEWLCRSSNGSEWIDARQFICCNGKFSKYNENHQRRSCCRKSETEQKIYIKEEQYCCGGFLYNKTKQSEPIPKCCGSVLLTKANEFCCRDEKYEMSNQYGFCHRSKYDGTEFPVKPNKTVCEIRLKNGSIDRKFHDSKTNWDCCGTELYDLQTCFCQENKIWPKGSRVSKCDKKLYDMNKMVCCDNELMEAPDSGITGAKYLGIKPNYDCVNKTLVDRDLNQVVRETVLPNNFRLCGNNFYDPHNKRTQVECCNGVVNHAALNMDVSCCDTVLIDRSQYGCCNNRKYPLTSTKQCCGNNFYDITGDNKCCGNQLINSTFLCCQPQSGMFIPVIKQHERDNACCNLTPYYNWPGKNVDCCAGQLKEIKHNQDFCYT